MKSNIEFPKYPHSAVVCGQTGCGKSVFGLDLLEKEFQGVFKTLIILCPTIEWNKAYKTRSWIGEENIFIVNPVLPDGTEKLQGLLRLLFNRFAWSPTLYIIDDCSATKELTKKKDMLSQLAFSGRHAEQSVWVILQRYISVLKDLQEQAKLVCMYYTEDRDSFEHCLRENDVVPADERQKKNCLNSAGHSAPSLPAATRTGFFFCGPSLLCPSVGS